MAALFVIGYPLRRVLDEQSGRLAAIPAPLIGLAAVQVTSWYWYEIGGRGSTDPVLGLVAVGMFASAARIRLDRQRRRRPDLRRVRMSFAAVALAAGVILLNFGSLFRLPFLTTANLGNNDAPSYAIVSQHLAHKGFGDIGNIAGTNLGKRSQAGDFGATTYLAAMSAILRRPVWKVTMVAMFAIIGMLFYSMALLLDELVPGHTSLVSLAAAASCCTLLFTYIASEYFLSQVMAMAATPLLALILLRARAARTLRDKGRLAATTSLVVLVIMSTYFHMLLLAPVVVLLPALAAGWDNRRRGAVMAVPLVAGALMAMAAVPQWVLHGYLEAKADAAVPAGWTLAPFWPVEVLGFLRHVAPGGVGPRVLWSVVVIVVLGVSLWYLYRDHHRLVRYTLGAVLLTAVSYMVLLAVAGTDSYRQWKWISFFQPLDTSLVLVVVGLAVVSGRRRWAPRLTSSMAVVPVLLFAAIVSVDLGRHSGVAMRGRRPSYYATEALAGLHADASLRHLSAVNVKLAPYWETMWAAYFLEPTVVYPESPTYYPTAPGIASATVAPSAPGVSLPGSRMLSHDFQLLSQYRGLSSVSGSGLTAQIVAQSVGPERAARPTVVWLRIRNTGSSGWLPAGPATGAVGLGVHLADPYGSVITFEWCRQPIVDPADQLTLTPGSEVVVSASLPALPAGDYTAQIDMVSEHVGWFGSTLPIPLHIR